MRHQPIITFTRPNRQSLGASGWIGDNLGEWWIIYRKRGKQKTAVLQDVV